MRESIGGAFMIKLVLVFIVIYISFMAVAINYAKTFRIKNGLIDILEQSQYDGNIDSIKDKLDAYILASSYRDPTSNQNYNQQLINKCGSGSYYRGICIEHFGTGPEVGKQDYYKVTVYLSLELPFFSINMIAPISGETTTIRKYSEIE